MGLLDRFFSWNGSADPLPLAAPAPRSALPAGSTTYDLSDPALADLMRGGGHANRTGRPVNERSAMSNATFQRAAKLIAGAIGMLPLNLIRTDADGAKSLATDHPIYTLLRKRPNRMHSPLDFKGYMQGRALLYGNAYAYKVPGLRGIQALWPLDPRQVEPMFDWATLQLAYKYNPTSGGQKVFAQSEIFHLRAPWSTDGVNGDGLLKLAAEVLGLAEITDASAAAILRNATQPGGVLKHPKQLSAEAQQRLRDAFEDKHAGVENTGRWMVAEEGMDVTPFPSSGKDAESVSQRKLQAEEIGRVTGVPRPLLMFDETSWGTGIEQLGIFFVTYCLAPWFVAWEEAIARDLLTDAEQDTLAAKFDEAELMRGSPAQQAEFLAKALGGPGTTGFMTPNEARERMDLNPEPWGDTPGWTQGTPNVAP